MMTIQVGDQRSSGFGLLEVAVIAVVRYSEGVEKEIRDLRSTMRLPINKRLRFGAKKTDDLN